MRCQFCPVASFRPHRCSPATGRAGSLGAFHRPRLRLGGGWFVAATGADECRAVSGGSSGVPIHRQPTQDLFRPPAGDQWCGEWGVSLPKLASLFPLL